MGETTEGWENFKGDKSEVFRRGSKEFGYEIGIH
jgi:hypothetical protein